MMSRMNHDLRWPNRAAIPQDPADPLIGWSLWLVALAHRRRVRGGSVGGGNEARSAHFHAVSFHFQNPDCSETLLRPSPSFACICDTIRRCEGGKI